MLLIIRQKAAKEELKKIAEDFQGYVKVVVDLQREIVSAGGERHFEGEQKLLEDGSYQENLWGGGIDLDSKETDYNSVINLRPRQNNPSRDILSSDIRKKFDKIVKRLILG